MYTLFMHQKGLTDLTEIWKQDFFLGDDDASFEWISPCILKILTRHLSKNVCHVFVCYGKHFRKNTHNKFYCEESHFVYVPCLHIQGVTEKQVQKFESLGLYLLQNRKYFNCCFWGNLRMITTFFCENCKEIWL